MKRFLLTSALILALVVSLSAGTMAAYNQSVATLSTEVSTKKMDIVAVPSTSEEFKVNFEIAPGDKITRSIELTNKGEISAATAFAANLSKSVEGVTMKIEKTGGTATASITKESDISSSAASTLEINEAVKYTVTVEWDYGSSRNDKANDDTSFTLNISVNAKSVNEGRVNGAETEA